MIGEFIGQMTRQMSNHLWQSTWFAVAAALLVLAFRKNRAQVRYWLWLSASLKFLIPFSLLMNLGNGLWGALAARNIATEIATPEVSLTLAQITQPFPDTLSLAPSAMHTANWILIAILGAWACGFSCVALMRFRGWLRIRAAVRASTPIKIAATVEVRSSPGLLEPGVVGFLNPVLLLPEGILKSLTPSQLEAVLAHELCHVRQRDNLTAAIHMIVEAVFWFHPLVWWIGARLVEERERACDEDVLSLGSEPRDYVDAILNVCKLYVESPLVCVSGISGSDLKNRIVRIMACRLAEKLTPGRKVLLITAAVAAIICPLAFGIINAPLLRAQSSAADWEKAAGGKVAFDVASVRQNKLGPPQPGHNLPISNIPLGDEANYSPTGGLFSATNFPLATYILFAYKLPNDEFRSVVSQLPKWAIADRFDVEARAGSNSTKDQYRLMMQSLLADRFKLAVHFETRQTPVFELVLVKPGKTGPQLRPHLDDPPCAAASASSSATVSGGFPTVCGKFVPLPASTAGRQSMGARDLTWGHFANLIGLMGRLDRPVLDKTGLSGNFDFILEWTPESSRPAPDFQPDESGPTFLEAVQDELGLKLESQTRPVEILVLDHVEEPSAN